MEMTTEEIKALQTELGVTADGIIGPNTRAAAQDRVNNLRMGQDIDPNIFSVTGTTGLVRGSDVTEEEVDEPVVVDDDDEPVVVDDDDVTFTSYMLYNSTGAGVLVNSEDEATRFKTLGFTLLSPPKDSGGGGVDTSALSDLLGTYATSSQVQEIAQTGPSTFEQAKGLYPYLDERLVRLFLNKYAESGNERLALAEMRADPIMAEIYPGIKRNDGSLRMTEQEYVAAVDNMKATVRTYNLNPNEFADDIAQAISGDVSPLEFRQRMEAGYEGVVNNIPQVKQAYLENFGIDLPDESIFAMFVSPNVSTKILEGQIRASQVIGEAENAGLGGITAQVGQSLVQQGLTQEGARKGFGQAALTLEGLQRAAARQSRRGPTASEYVEATQLGQAEELKNLQNITSQIQSESAAVLGAARTQTGQVVGLEEA